MKKESQKQGFVQGAMILMIGTVTVKVVSMLFKIPVSNMLGGTGYSYFTNAYEIFNLLSTIAAAGFPVAVSKMVSENCVTESCWLRQIPIHWKTAVKRYGKRIFR